MGSTHARTHVRTYVCRHSSGNGETASPTGSADGNGSFFDPGKKGTLHLSPRIPPSIHDPSFTATPFQADTLYLSQWVAASVSNDEKSERKESVCICSLKLRFAPVEPHFESRSASSPLSTTVRQSEHFVRTSRRSEEPLNALLFFLLRFLFTVRNKKKKNR